MQRGFRQHGFINLTTYLRTYKVGDYVDVKVNAAIHKVSSKGVGSVTNNRGLQITLVPQTTLSQTKHGIDSACSCSIAQICSGCSEGSKNKRSFAVSHKWTVTYPLLTTVTQAHEVEEQAKVARENCLAFIVVHITYCNAMAQTKTLLHQITGATVLATQHIGS